ncbi:toll/interleukin-1 receptor domain-containing protein [Flavobacterium cerinum]|uniref:Toll/interleukin-1 receptor domain-containing protein n=1 Tax=Flavobacterium cerinum TaxID=2502784 RepID=A0ABY5IQP8_9FLAO|nr:toll/interleukin-1 receptor domain-containing protein [Flavobacterium cerinum]UUC45143.1 toll/interleukin-1 receptor domain-containing protein [Flavobacterium cerinum]
METKISYHSPNVFISYSWDNEEHKAWVLDLSEVLFNNGINVILDQYELNAGSNMHFFMETSVSKSDKVIIIFTPKYKEKAEQRINGVGFEYSLINSELYNQIATNTKFVPVLRSGSFHESIPAFMQQFITVDMRDNLNFSKKSEELIMALYDKSVLEKPTLGQHRFVKKNNGVILVRNHDNTVTTLKDIRFKTRFLWEELTKLKNKNYCEADIRNSVLELIKNSIDYLQINGLITYETKYAYNMNTTGEPVNIIQIKNISTEIKNLIVLINDNKI